jgi:hypothetical protein
MSPPAILVVWFGNILFSFPARRGNIFSRCEYYLSPRLLVEATVDYAFRGNLHRWNVATSNISGLVWLCCSALARRGISVLLCSEYYLSPRLLVEGEGGSKLSLYTIFTMRHPFAQLDHYQRKQYVVAKRAATG